MCCNVGGVSFFFFAGGEKETNKFSSNLHYPIKKLNPFLFHIITIVSVCSSVFLHLLPTFKCKFRKGLRVISFQVTQKVKADF